MRDRTHRCQRVRYKEPAGAGLHRDMHLLAGEALGPQRVRRPGVDPPTAHLARHGVQHVGVICPAVHVNTATIASRACFEFRHLATQRERSRTEPREAPFMASF
jgi:hypothetical protein